MKRIDVARLYSNENFPLPVVNALRGLGHDVVTIQERGRAGEAVSDPEVLKLAVSEDRAVLTINRKDFIKLHRIDPDHAGIIVCTLDSDFTGQATRIHDALVRCPDLKRQLLRVNRPPG
jgi:hypothetical protein